MTTFHSTEARELAKADLNFLAALVLGDMYEHAFPAMHILIYNLIKENVVKLRDFTKLALGLPRGFAKTTLIKLCILWIVLFSDKRFILIVASTATKAEAILADIVGFLNTSNVQALFGDWKATATKDTQTHKVFHFRGRQLTLLTIGAGGDPRGFNVGNERPDCIIMDDMQSRENAMSEVESKALYAWMYATLLKTKSPRGCLYVFIGNMYPSEGSILRKLKTNPDWVSFITGAILADGTSLWEEVHPVTQLLDELRTDVNAGMADVFMSEVMNDAETTAMTGFDPDKLLPWNEDLAELALGSFIIIDPATGKNKKTDDVCMIYCEMLAGKPWVREKHSGKWAPKELLQHALRLATEKRCSLVCLESAGSDTTLYWFREVCKEWGVTGVHAMELFPRGIPKANRIFSMLKAAMNKEFGISPKAFPAFLYEVRNWNPMKTNNIDNFLDAVAYIPQVLELYSHLISFPGLSHLIDPDEDTDFTELETSPI